MVQPADPMGLPAAGFTPYGAMDAMYNWATYGPNQALAMALAQYQGQNQLAQQAMQSNASMANAATAAGASVAGAQIGAQGQLDSQYIASIAQLQGLDASIKADLIRAAGGDQNDINKLNATLQMQAGIANQNMAWNLAQAGGSGNLIDNFARMRYLGGTGPQPGFESALNGLPSPWVTAPQAQFTPYAQAPSVNTNLPQFSVGNGGWSGGGASQFSVPNAGNVGSLYSSMLPLMNNWANPNGNVIEFGEPTGLNGGVPINPTVAPGGNAPGGGTYTYDNQIMPSNTANQIALDGGLGVLNDAIYGPGNGPTPMASGGTLMPGEWGLVGENGPELRHKDMYGNDQIIPIRPMAEGGVIPAPTMDAAGIRRNAAGYSLESPLEKSMRRRKEAAATMAEAEAVLNEPDPPPTPVDNANASTNTYDAGLNQQNPLNPTPSIEPGALTPGGPTVSSLPFFQSLKTGNVGPAWSGNIPRPTAPWLGINEGVPLPFEASNTFQQSNPANQQAKLQLWQAIGVPPETAMYWIKASTPGYRFNQQAPLGF